jgi:hypothetical protein
VLLNEVALSRLDQPDEIEKTILSFDISSETPLKFEMVYFVRDIFEQNELIDSQF